MFHIYVGNLPFDATESDVQELFGQHGKVVRVTLMSGDAGRSRGFGFVEMPNEGEGLAAIEATKGQEYRGRTLKVDQARPQRPRSPVGRRR